MSMFLYNLFLLLIFPLFVIYLTVSSVFVKKWRKGLLIKLGIASRGNTERNAMVFHCVSVGETLSAVPLIKKFSIQGVKIVFTVTTETGLSIALKALKNMVSAIDYFPFDFPFTVAKFFRSYKPSSVVIVETEIWPNIIFFAKTNNVPIFFVNGRISDRSYPRYLRFAFFFRPLLGYPFFLMQTQKDAERIISLGADPKKVEVTGNIKYDLEKRPGVVCREKIGFFAEDIIIVAGSTHPGEEEVLVKCFSKLVRERSNVKMVIAPRHPERFDYVSNLLKESGVSFGRRSRGDKTGDMLLLDTIGELIGFYEISDICFVGGSLVNIGGHNIIEPAIYSKATIFGPYMQNFKEIRDEFVGAEAGIQVDGDSLFQTLKTLVDDSKLRDKLGQKAADIAEKNRGSIEKTLFYINKKLK